MDMGQLCSGLKRLELPPQLVLTFLLLKLESKLCIIDHK